MKFRIFSLSIMMVFAVVTVSSKPVNIQTARITAGNFLRQTERLYGYSPAGSYVIDDKPFVQRNDGLPVFYLFNLDPGFILISGDDAYTPVIGYSFESGLDLENAPAHVKGFIDNYAAQIAFIRDRQIPPSEEIQNEWADLLSGTTGEGAGLRTSREVEPLLFCKWDQGAPYNMLCPEDEAGPGGHVWVGCVATAMAQVMYYWRYPAAGTGSHCYWPGNWQYGQQCADFGNTYYNWEGMINSIDLVQVYPNAELQYHCAVSVDMDFSPNGSGSYSHMVPERLAAFWGYSDAQILWKDDYSHSEWVEILQEELDASHPMYYSGYSNEGGHAFVCDGYQGEYFHFNFGWGGSANGYFTLDNVGGFSYGQACIRYFVPSDPAYPYYIDGDHIMTSHSGSFTDGSGPVGNYTVNQNATWLIDLGDSGDSIAGISLSFSMFDLGAGDTVTIYNGTTRTDPILGAYTGTSVPQQINSTGDAMLVAFSSDSQVTGGGFYAEYYANSAVFCAGMTTMTDMEGSMNDGSGSYNYHSNSYCTWYIRPEEAGTITLTFHSFDTESGVDKVTVFDGNVKVGEFSGQEVPEPVVAQNGSIFMTWLTDGDNTGQGWSASYEAEAVGITEDPSASSINIYPNPASGKINIEIKADREEEMEIRLVTLLGVDKYKGMISVRPGTNRITISVEDIPAGQYFVELGSPLQKTVRQIAVIH
ncbi:MAG TPA: C10 family peptidase [Bacteroidales bacterium]|nr:C10 family peptidase [Bacteroidales bacterium]